MIGKSKRKAMIASLYKVYGDGLGDIELLDDETLTKWHSELKVVYICFSCDGESDRPTGLCDWCKNLMRSMNKGYKVSAK